MMALVKYITVFSLSWSPVQSLNIMHEKVRVIKSSLKSTGYKKMYKTVPALYHYMNTHVFLYLYAHASKKVKRKPINVLTAAASG